MASIGDLVTRLVCDASQYTTGTDQARAGNKALSGSIDSIIGQLERQKKQMAVMGKTTQDNIISQGGKGASEGSVNYALQLNSEIEAIRKKARAEEEAAAAMKRSQMAGDSLIQTLTTQKATLGMTTNQLQIYRAQQAGASAADIQRATALQHEISGLIQAKEAQEALAQQSVRTAAAANGMNRNSMVLTESVRGLEDAVAGFTNNGLKGMLMATTNNVNQIGALAGGTAGLALSVGSIAALIGVSLLPKLIDWARGTAEIAKETERLNQIRQEAHESEMRRMDQRINRFAEERRAELQHRDLMLPEDKPKPLSDRGGQLEAARAAYQLENEIQQQIVQNEEERQKEITARNPALYKGGDPSKRPKWEKDDPRIQEAKDFDRSVEATTEAIRRRDDAERRMIEARRELERQTVMDIATLKDEQRKKDLEKHRKWAKMAAEEEARARQSAADAVMNITRDSNPAVAAMLEKRRREADMRNRVQDAIDRGIITGAEGKSITDQIGKMQKASTSGFAPALQTGTTAAYSAALKAMSKPEEDKQIVADRENTEKLALLLEKIEAKAAVTVTTVSF